MDYTEWIAGRISQLRIQRGVSARDMSLSLGQSESYINKIENKRIQPSMQGFLYICEYLEISPKEFFDTDMPDPLKVRQIAAEAEGLTSEQADHVLQIIRDITSR